MKVFKQKSYQKKKKKIVSISANQIIEISILKHQGIFQGNIYFSGLWQIHVVVQINIRVLQRQQVSESRVATLTWLRL